MPRTAEDFEKYWLTSAEFKQATGEVEKTAAADADGKEALEDFRESHHVMQAKHTRPESPYVVSIPMQVRLCTTRAYQRLWNDKASTMYVHFPAKGIR